MMSLVRFSRRQLHTIISRETIKPSSPTPRHRKTYNLSVFDQIVPDVYLPIVAFYPNSKTIDILHLKKSLSQTLTRYYPFAGSLPKGAPSVVDCNDNGVEFIEAANDNVLSRFVKNMQHEDLDQIFPNGLVWRNKKLQDHKMEKDDGKMSIAMAVQVNSFSCGGIAIAVSLSHKIADGSSLCNFFNDWAVVARKNGSQIDPHFISFKNVDLNFEGYSVDKSLDDCVTKSFMFPNSKINDLKLRVISMTENMESERRIIDPTRVEVLNWLLYNRAVQAATENNGGCFRPTGLLHIINLRNKMMESLPATSIGNLYRISMLSTKNQNEIMPSCFIKQLRELKKGVKGIKSIESEIGSILSQDGSGRIEEQRKIDEYYLFSSLCRYPVGGIDFGFGKPVKVTVAGAFKRNEFIAMDAGDPDGGGDGDGIQVQVTLGKEDMEVFERDPELLSFC